ncbi:MAG: hypothetical protein QM579_12335 [Desulfovibrio sp.]|uniref:hypothetical protein n=1 Tax=Desulfovibrio sp. TaxID=885 RepID=UPI0039E3A93B
MYKNIAFFCLFVLLCSCGPLPVRNQSGLFGEYTENFIDTDGFTLWMPKNMHARPGIYDFVVQKYINYCVNGNYNGGKFESNEIYKELSDGGRVYAYYYYYDKDFDAGADDPAFNLKPISVRVYFTVIMNFIVDKEGVIKNCKYMRIRN